MLAPARVLAIVAATTAPLCFSPAQQPVISLPRDARMHVQTWSTSSGLPQNTVTSLLQARDGTLLVGTFGGLCRFDGLQWQGSDSCASDKLDQRVTAVCDDADGTLWIGTQASTLQRVRAGKAERIAVMPGTAASFVQRLLDGRIVVGTDVDVFVVDEEGAVTPFARTPLRGSRLVLRAWDGEQWLIAHSGVHRLTAPAPERLWPVPSSAGLVASDGTVYVGTNQGLVRWRGNTFEPVAELPAAAPRSGVVCAVAESRTGELWIAFEGCLCRFSPTGATPSLVLPVSPRIRALHTTSDGSLWIGFDNAGLARLRASEVVLAAQTGESGAPVGSGSVAPDGAGGWFVGTDHGLHRWQGSRFQRDERLGDGAIGAIHEADGVFWFGTVDGLTALHRGGVVAHRAPAPVGLVRAIHADGTGRLWCGTAHGLWWFRDGKWSEPPHEIALSCEVVKLIAAGHDGELWIATTTSLSCVTAALEQRVRLRIGVDLPHGEVRAVLPRDRGRVWLGTYGAGFVALDGERRTVVGAAAGLHDRFVCSVLPLEQRWLVGSNRGTFLIDPDDLDLVADGRRSELICRPLLGAKGPAAEANGGVQPSIARAGSTVMLCGVAGLLEVDLGSLQPPAKAPPCRIERVVAGGHPAALENGAIRLGADRERVFTFQASAPEFDLPELLRFRWRLLPDPQWSAPSCARTVSFDVHGPGEYHFEVAAVGADERTVAEPARVGIVVEPRAWERTSFRIGAIALLAAGVWLAVRFGGRRHARSAARLGRLVDERTAELRQLHAELERRVADRTGELQEALRTIEQDHTQRLELERELQTFQRMESLGALASGIAHDFNNLLTVVLGNVQLIEVEHPRQPELLRLAKRIRDTAEQGQLLTRHLLTAASQESITATVIDLGGCVRALRPLLEQLAGGRVRVEVDAGATPVAVRLSPVQLEQILSNLCANARDAMPGGGVVRIAVSTSGARAVLKVSDTGTGMSDDVKRRAFEPFFTTKQRSGGTGMGLATVYGITKQAGGTVTIDSTPGSGTTFVFSLPLASAERVVELPRAAAPAPAEPRFDQQGR